MTENERLYQNRCYAEFARKTDAIKLASGCVDCGYAKHAAALGFDHKDPTTKKFKISESFNRKWSNVLEEIAKCEVRCANCHAVRTFLMKHGSHVGRTK